jgi:hypothetical protein
VFVDAQAAFTIPLTNCDVWAVGTTASSPTSSTGFFKGCLADIWFDHGTYKDVTDPSNLNLFIEFGRAVNLGDNGETPLGTQPIIYLGNPASTIEENLGDGGDFSIEGSPTICESNPSKISLPTDITVFRRSKIIHLAGFDLFDIKGWITYLRAFPATVTITFEFSGTNVFDQAITVQLPSSPVLGVYNGNAYYNGDFYYNAGFEGRLSRQKFSAAGRASFCQVKVEVTGAEDVEISELGFWFSVAKDN